MRYINILRHCEYDDRSGPGPNFDCHLSANGHEHAQRIGRAMNAQNIRPDLIYCSGATRTRETLEGLTKSIASPKVIFNDEIFGCMPGDLLSLIQDTDEQYKDILIIGHNPAMHGLVQILGQHSDPQYFQEIAYVYRPGTLCRIHSDALSWDAIAPDNGKISALINGA